MNLQKAYELDIAREKLGNTIEEIIHYQPSEIVRSVTK